MREIKFRVWCVDKEEFDYEVVAGNILSAIHGGDDPLSAEEEKSFILQQYTGLTDKNSKEIYEGDILKYTFDGDSYPEEAVDKIFICEWDQNNAWFVFKEHDDDVSDAYYWLEIKGYCEVIGNIFENSELLEQ